MSKLATIENKIRDFAERNSPYTNVIGLSRSLIAFGTLLTLLSNSVNTLFIQKVSNSFLLSPFQSEFSKKINFFFLFGENNLVLMKWLAVFILLLVIIGYLQKITCFLHWWVSFSFLHSATIIDGGDQIASILTLLLIPICFLDNRKNHWNLKIPQSKLSNLISICFVYVICLQVAIIYFHAAVGKFGHEQWTDGTAIYYWLNHSVFGMPDNLAIFNFFLQKPFFVSWVTYGVLILELMLFLALFTNVRYRKIMLCIALIFHLLIVFYHGIFSFFFPISAALMLYLYPTYKNLNLKYMKSWENKVKFWFFIPNGILLLVNCILTANMFYQKEHIQKIDYTAWVSILGVIGVLAIAMHVIKNPNSKMVNWPVKITEENKKREFKKIQIFMLIVSLFFSSVMLLSHFDFSYQ